VAERLGFRYVDDEVIGQAAEWAELDPGFVADAERRRPLAARMLGQIAGQATPTRLPGGATGRALPTDDDLRILIGDALHALAQEGSVVIVAHAASFALAGGDVLRVLVTAPPRDRAVRLAAVSGVDERGAARLVKAEDAARADYLKRFYGVERERPVHYDLVVNTERLDAGEAASVIVATAGA
jgi:hypothetical protein